MSTFRGKGMELRMRGVEVTYTTVRLSCEPPSSKVTRILIDYTTALCRISFDLSLGIFPSPVICRLLHEESRPAY